MKPMIELNFLGSNWKWLPGQDWLRLAFADKGLFLEEEWLGMAFG